MNTGLDCHMSDLGKILISNMLFMIGIFMILWGIKRYIERKNAIFISTPFSRAAANRLESWDVPAYKIGSGECNNYPLIEHIAKFKKPMIVTAMGSLTEFNISIDNGISHMLSFSNSKNYIFSIIHNLFLLKK